MRLVSITRGWPCPVRVYSCMEKRARKIVDVEFDATPNKDEVEQLRVNPVAFVHAANRPEAA